MPRSRSGTDFVLAMAMDGRLGNRDEYHFLDDPTPTNNQAGVRDDCSIARVTSKRVCIDQPTLAGFEVCQKPVVSDLVFCHWRHGSSSAALGRRLLAPSGLPERRTRLVEGSHVVVASDAPP